MALKEVLSPLFSFKKIVGNYGKLYSESYFLFQSVS